MNQTRGRAISAQLEVEIGSEYRYRESVPNPHALVVTCPEPR